MLLRNLAKKSRWTKSWHNCEFEYFTTQGNITGNFSAEEIIRQKNKMENIEKELAVFQEYKKAKAFQSQQKYTQSNELLQRVLDIFERSRLQNSDSYLYLLQRLAQNEISLHNIRKADTYLQKAISNTDFSKKENLIDGNFQNLFLLYLRTDVEKALNISKKALASLQEKGASIQEQSILLFYLGTAHFLCGSYEEAIRNFNKCIENIPQSSLKGSALNNLALTLWWKAPNPGKEPVSEIVFLFKESVLNNEHPSQLDEGQRKDFDELFRNQTLLPNDYAKFISDEQALVKNKESIIPLFNIASFLFSLGSQTKNETAFWIRYAMKVTEKNDPENMNRILLLLAKFYGSSKQYIRAEGLFRRVLELSENIPETKFNCLKAYGETLQTITNRKNEGDNMLEEAKNLEKQIHSWALKLDHLSLPEINL